MRVVDRVIPFGSDLGECYDLVGFGEGSWCVEKPGREPERPLSHPFPDKSFHLFQLVWTWSTGCQPHHFSAYCVVADEGERVYSDSVPFPRF